VNGLIKRSNGDADPILSVDLTVSEERRDEFENGHASQGNCFSRLSSPTTKKRRSVELINNKNTKYVNVSMDSKGID